MGHRGPDGQEAVMVRWRVPRVERRADGAAPIGLQIAGGAAVVIVGVVVTALIPVSAGESRVAPPLLALALACAFVGAMAGVAIAVLCGLSIDGFVLGGDGVLTWHGVTDVALIGLVVGSAAVGAIAGRTVRWIRRAEPVSMPAQAENPM